MAKLPVLSGREVIKILGKAGFKPVRQKGSHIVVLKETSESKRAVVVPNHKEIDTGYFAGDNQAGRFETGSVRKIAVIVFPDVCSKAHLIA